MERKFNFSQATRIKPIHYKKCYRLLESTLIFKTNHIKQCPGFYKISPYLADIMLDENNIKIENEFLKKVSKNIFSSKIF